MTKRTSLILIILTLTALFLAACGTGAAPAAEAVVDSTNLPQNVDAATVKALSDNPDVVLLDVREPNEYEAGHIPGITLIPMSQVANRLAEIPRDKPVIVTCRSGNRSAEVTDYLRQQGYTNIHNMKGGILAWEQAGYPVEKGCTTC